MDSFIQLGMDEGHRESCDRPGGRTGEGGAMEQHSGMNCGALV